MINFFILSEGFVWKRSSKARVVTSKSEIIQAKSLLSEGFVWKRSSKARVVTSKSDVNSNVMPQFIVVFMK